MSRSGAMLTVALLAALAVGPMWGAAQRRSIRPPADTAPTEPTEPAQPVPPGTTPQPPGPAEPPAAGAAPGAAGSTPPRTVAVDSRGGPLTLAEDVTAAIERWRQAVPELVAIEVGGAAAGGDRIVFGDPALLGPDTLSLGLRFQGSPGIETRLHPQQYRNHPAVLLHEIGVFLGLPEGGEGVMAFAVATAGELDAPSPADLDALRDLRRFRAEDLTRDGVVDFDDLVAFGQAFGSQGVNLPADLDGDGSVGPSDLTVLRAAYSFTPPAEPETPAEPGAAPGEPAPGEAEPGDGGPPAEGVPPDEAPPPDAPPPDEEPPPDLPPPEEAPPPDAPPSDGTPPPGGGSG